MCDLMLEAIWSTHVWATHNPSFEIPSGVSFLRSWMAARTMKQQDILLYSRPGKRKRIVDANFERITRQITCWRKLRLEKTSNNPDSLDNASCTSCLLLGNTCRTREAHENRWPSNKIIRQVTCYPLQCGITCGCMNVHDSSLVQCLRRILLVTLSSVEYTYVEYECQSVQKVSCYPSMYM